MEVNEYTSQPFKMFRDKVQSKSYVYVIR